LVVLLLNANRTTSTTSNPIESLRKFDAALALWRGPAMSGLVEDPGIRSRALPFDEERTAVVEDRFDLELVLGRHEAAVGTLERSLAEHPYRQRVWAQLMIARTASRVFAICNPNRASRCQCANCWDARRTS
jgi:hypothetical protein